MCVYGGREVVSFELCLDFVGRRGEREDSQLNLKALDSICTLQLIIFPPEESASKAN